METYIYDGPVTCFGKIVAYNWYGETIAKTARKALSNLSYQFKKKLGYGPNAKFKLDIDYLRKEDDYGDE